MRVWIIFASLLLTSMVLLGCSRKAPQKPVEVGHLYSGSGNQWWYGPHGLTSGPDIWSGDNANGGFTHAKPHHKHHKFHATGPIVIPGAPPELPRAPLVEQRQI